MFVRVRKINVKMGDTGQKIASEKLSFKKNKKAIETKEITRHDCYRADPHKKLDSSNFCKSHT